MKTQSRRSVPTHPEFRGMPAKTKATLQAERVLDLMEQLSVKQGSIDDAKNELTSLMRQEKITTVVAVIPGTDRRKAFVLETNEKLKVTSA